MVWPTPDAGDEPMNKKTLVLLWGGVSVTALGLAGLYAHASRFHYWLSILIPVFYILLTLLGIRHIENHEQDD
jgi:hypothetical protein